MQTTTSFKRVTGFPSYWKQAMQLTGDSFIDSIPADTAISCHHPASPCKCLHSLWYRLDPCHLHTHLGSTFMFQGTQACVAHSTSERPEDPVYNQTWSPQCLLAPVRSETRPPRHRLVATRNTPVKAWPSTPCKIVFFDIRPQCDTCTKK